MFKHNYTKFIIITSSICMSGLTMAGQPEGSGSSIWRNVNHDFIVLVDEKKKLAYSIGVDLNKFCQGEGPEFGGLLTKQVTNPSELISANILSKGDELKTYVFKYTGVGVCHDFLNYPIASGTSDSIYRNNDYFYNYSDGKNENTWGLSTHGVFENAFTGERQVFNSNYKCIAKNSNYSCVTSLRLK